MADLHQIQTEFTNVSSFLTALGDQKRQAIIISLLKINSCEGLQVPELTSVTGLSRPAVSHHLKILKDAHLVAVRSEGTKNFYYLSHDIKEIDELKTLLDHVTAIIHQTETKS
ncbi:ArsR family transcriptional regulator [Lentilactobacillus buchneri]|uniref:ArsR/SmtB family transcription factor n=1 Tax=Lentilactobacillus buchneri TaxID=1581 RepID=UPI0021A57D3C|nr:metalloregulator ArsR/SmtB family transcription factor [Lentilactobacillus buchneri]MCT2898130.1 ArsR family transcriptional regulator [Lentilactobacillus buchneri]